MERGGAVEKHRMVLNHVFQDVPDHRLLPLDHFLGGLDGGAVAFLLESVIDEGLEQFERHLFRQTALVKLQVRAHHDDGAAGIIHAFPQQVLAEAALLALERIG